jgi:hypothetical protein
MQIAPHIVESFIISQPLAIVTPTLFFGTPRRLFGMAYREDRMILHIQQNSISMAVNSHIHLIRFAISETWKQWAAVLIAYSTGTSSFKDFLQDELPSPFVLKPGDMYLMP